MKDNLSLGFLTSSDVSALKEKRVIIPVGSIEQHGPHLPLNTDSLLVEKIAAEVGRRTGCVVAPTLSFGVSEEHMDFPGTLSLKPETFKDMLSYLCGSLLYHGFSRQFIVNHHGGNRRYIEELLPKLRKRGVEVSLHGVLGRLGGFDHAGVVETSLMLYLFPELVRKKEIRKFEFSVPEGTDWKTSDHSKSGVIGDAHLASKEKGEEYFNRIGGELTEELENG